MDKGESMFKLVLRFFLLTVLTMTTVFAEEESSNFLKQGNIEYSEPNDEASYFATRGAIPSRISQYIGADFSVIMTTVKPTLEKGYKEILTQTDGERDVLHYGAIIFAGLGSNFDRFYLGGEASVAFNTMDRDIQTSNDKVKLTIKQPFELGVDIIPGYLARSGKTMFYGRFGVGGGWIRVGVKDFVGETAFDNSVGEMNFGLRFGCGVQFITSDSLRIRTEYLVTRYNNKNHLIKEIGDGYDGHLGTSLAHRFNLGFVLNF